MYRNIDILYDKMNIFIIQEVNQIKKEHDWENIRWFHLAWGVEVFIPLYRYNYSISNYWPYGTKNPGTAFCRSLHSL